MKFFFGVFLLSFLFSASIFSQDLEKNYLLKWEQFYPSQALNLGIRAAVFDYEHRSTNTINEWILLNENILIQLSKPEPKINPINGRLLRVQAQKEVDKWKSLSEHTSSFILYSRLISNAIPTLLEVDYLLSSEKASLLCKRLIAIKNLTNQAQTNLTHVSKLDLEIGLEGLSNTLDFLKKDLSKELLNKGIQPTCISYNILLEKATLGMEALQEYGKTTLQKNTKESKMALGMTEYDRRLGLYTDSDLTSKQLAVMAMDEIETVKTLMTEIAVAYLKETYPYEKLPKTDLKIIKLALADMEKDTPSNAEDYLKFWRKLADKAVDFIQKNDIATLPKNTTLGIQTAPESAGAAARIGWVASAPPFDPNPMTILNLPSIPESLPKQEQVEFWASFNKPFNRMIVIHELYPGHYMQLKVSRETPHPIRLMFPYGTYIEGWATFTEKVLLDAGWQEGNHLTILAHLRKRLENANRAYTSVQVHCNGWNQDQVLKFSTETSLLAPQFAKSLWGRIMNSPMQLTSYFLGGKQFKEVLEFEKKRLGNSFILKNFMDTIMIAGPIPIDEFYQIFKSNNPN